MPTEHAIEVLTFTKGQRKDDVAAEHLAHFSESEGVLFVGKAQDKTPVFRTEKRRNPQTGQPYPWIVRSTAMVNHYHKERRDLRPETTISASGWVVPAQGQGRPDLARVGGTHLRKFAA
jgi:hypothetical protein